MIITRTPFRITLGGGGTDLPSYYSRNGGFILSAGINKYMFINLNKIIVDDLIRIKYSKSETISSLDEIQHTIVREVLRMVGVDKGIEIASMADIPAGTGLGSSSSFCVGLINALHTFKREYVSRHDLAEEACTIEIDILKKPIGKQDQYLATYGGLTILEIDTNGIVDVHPLLMDNDAMLELQENILLFYTGIKRDGEEILTKQDEATNKNDENVVNRLHKIKEMGIEIRNLLEKGKLREFGEMLNVHWETKRKLSDGITSKKIDEWYDIAMKNGAVGGKLTGAGGGGFLLFYCEENKTKIRQSLLQEGLRELRFNFDFEGSKILVNLF